jgi:hypothetical protein
VASNYSFKFDVGTVTVGQAALTVIAKPASMTYGSVLPALTYSFSGFVNGDGISTVQGTPLLTAGATSASPVGSYPIACGAGTLTSQEYTFNCVNGTLTVNQAAISVTGASLAMTYGGTVPGLSYQLSGFLNGDTATVVSGAPVLASSVTAASPVGVYPIVISAGSLSAANYAFTAFNGTVTVMKALLMVTPSSQKMTYGGVIPALTYTVTGFVNGDSPASVTGTPQMSTTATGSSVPGSYTITATPGSLAARNYSFGFIQGSMSVVPAVLTVSANNLVMQVGGTLPPLTYSTSGWVNGDTQATASTGAPALTTSASTSSQAGSYSIVAGQGNMSAGNYQCVFVNGTLLVNQSSANLIKILRR